MTFDTAIYHFWRLNSAGATNVDLFQRQKKNSTSRPAPKNSVDPAPKSAIPKAKTNFCRHHTTVEEWFLPPGLSLLPQPTKWYEKSHLIYFHLIEIHRKWQQICFWLSFTNKLPSSLQLRRSNPKPYARQLLGMEREIRKLIRSACFKHNLKFCTFKCHQQFYLYPGVETVAGVEPKGLLFSVALRSGSTNANVVRNSSTERAEEETMSSRRRQKSRECTFYLPTAGR